MRNASLTRKILRKPAHEEGAEPFRRLLAWCTDESGASVVTTGGQGCQQSTARPGRTPAGQWVIEVYAPEEVATRLRKSGVRVEVDKEFEKRSLSRRAEVNAGDRFQDGRLPPRGVGRKE